MPKPRKALIFRINTANYYCMSDAYDGPFSVAVMP